MANAGDTVLIKTVSTTVSQSKAKDVYTALRGVTGWSSLWNSSSDGHPTKFVIERKTDGTWQVTIQNDKFEPASLSDVGPGAVVRELTAAENVDLNT